MSAPNSASLARSKCAPCEGGVAALTAEQASEYLQATPKWSLNDDQTAIARSWKLKSFVEGIEMINAIGKIAETEQHHPDLHLTGYRHLKVELSTHAIGGLSENDFILAAKIDELAP